MIKVTGLWLKLFVPSEQKSVFYSFPQMHLHSHDEVACPCVYPDSAWQGRRELPR